MTQQKKAAYTVFFALVALFASFVALALVDSNSLRTIASFSTDLSTRGDEQRHNILRAASRIDGVVVKPGAKFSFNDAVGLCRVAQGYERALTIIDGELRPAWGGGVCQVSSTLYNAALLANLKVTQRRAHSRLVRSVPPGRDATTAFGIADLRFVNTTHFPIRIISRASATRLVVSILGKSDPNTTVEIVTESIDTNACETVLTYRIVRKAGEVIKRELISKDTYEVRR
jgi:vancomycin resistance protein YoaR